MQILTLDKPGVRLLREQIEFLLAPLRIQGIEFLFRGGLPHPGKRSATVKFEFMLTDVDGKAESAEAVCFREHCGSYGLEQGDFGRVFRLRCGTYRIIGLNIQAVEYPVIVEKVDTHKRFKFPAHEVQICLEAGIDGINDGKNRTTGRV